MGVFFEIRRKINRSLNNYTKPVRRLFLFETVLLLIIAGVMVVTQEGRKEADRCRQYNDDIKQWTNEIVSEVLREAENREQCNPVRAARRTEDS